MNIKQHAGRTLLGGFVLLAALGAVACTDDDADADADAGEASSGGEVAVTDAWARATAGNPGENTAIYAMIENTTGVDDTLVSVSIPSEVAERSEVHEMVQRGENMAMQEIAGGLPVPAGEGVMLEPGGYHVMVMGVAEQLNPGDQFDVVFVFAEAGEMEVSVEVKEASAGAGGMSGMAH